MSQRWTTSAELRARLRKRWDRGELLAALIDPGGTPGYAPLFPLRLPLRGPSAGELSHQFDAARRWVAELRAMPHIRLELTERHHRQLGANQIPTAAWIDSLEQALALIGKTAPARRFQDLIALARQHQPALLAWLARRPLRALALHPDFARLLAVVDWVQRHPRPGIYPRQVDLPGVHSKFIEQHRAVLSEWLDLILPPTAINPNARGIAGFARRYGFRDKLPRVRFRLLDPGVPLLPGIDMPDISLDAPSFARLAPKVGRVFLTENEINFLAFPPLPAAMVIFGAGYGFESLRTATWLAERTLYYWGDIDTHGFAMLDQLRHHLPHVHSLLMDQETLFAFEPLWGEETEPCTRDLRQLTATEASLYQALRDHRIRPNLRLEQERIGFDWACKRLRALT